MKKLVVLIAALLSGCAITPMDWGRQPPDDWPALKVRIIEVPKGEVAGHCRSASYAFATVPRGCALVYFTRRECVIYVAEGYPEVLEHERGHCLGYDHPGETNFRDAWTRYKARNL